MPPPLALFIWLVLLLVLLRFDPARDSGTSIALWVPLTWMLIIGSRLPSQWFGATQMGVHAQNLEEGNPLDATIFSILILLALGILLSRSFKWGYFFTHNVALIMLISFALISVVWSDFPFIAFKRWFRDLGNYLVILVVISDPRPLEAVRTVLRRLCYVLIPLSMLLNKYYPALARQYDDWSGSFTFGGATTSKNMLGLLCLLSCIFFFWDTVTRWSSRKERRTKLIILVNLAFFGMTLSLLNIANSATSSVCLAIGLFVIAAAHSGWGKRYPGFLKVMIPATFCLYLILAFGFDLSGAMARQVGRDPTLHDRTLIWDTALSMNTNRFIGTGYESFWLGPRLLDFWQRSSIRGLNEVHNGYLEVYLSLGLVGVFLLGTFLLASYRAIWKKFRLSSSVASLGLAFWIITLFYNMTEAAALKGNLLWLTLLAVSVAVPERAADPALSVPAIENVGTTARVLLPRLEPASQRR